MKFPLVPEIINEDGSILSDRVWLSTRQAADYLGTTSGTLENWRYVGGGPQYAKLGRRVTYRRDWLDDWLEQRRVSNTAEAKRNGWG